jgi:hypothetical protein
MKKTLFFQLLLLFFLLVYPLVYSMFYQKNRVAVYENTKVYISDGGMVVKWVVEAKGKPVHFVRALSFRIFKDRFIYFIFDRHSISGNIIQPYVKINLKYGWPAISYNYVVLVSYESRKATILLNNRKFQMDLDGEM